MKRGNIRDTQIATLIYDELEYILATAEDGRLGELVVSQVESGRGGAHYVVLLAPADGSRTFRRASEVKLLLQRASRYLRAELAASLNLKRMPELTFLPDPVFPFSEPG